MNPNEIQESQFINRRFGNRSPMTRKSFSQIPRSVSEFNMSGLSLLEKYEEETEAVHLRNSKKRFKVALFAAVVGVLLVSAPPPSK